MALSDLYSSPTPLSTPCLRISQCSTKVKFLKAPLVKCAALLFSFLTLRKRSRETFFSCLSKVNSSGKTRNSVMCPELLPCSFVLSSKAEVTYLKPEYIAFRNGNENVGHCYLLHITCIFSTEHQMTFPRKM